MFGFVSPLEAPWLVRPVTNIILPPLPIRFWVLPPSSATIIAHNLFFVRIFIFIESLARTFPLPGLAVLIALVISPRLLSKETLRTNRQYFPKRPHANRRCRRILHILPMKPLQLEECRVRPARATKLEFSEGESSEFG